MSLEVMPTQSLEMKIQLGWELDFNLVIPLAENSVITYRTADFHECELLNACWLKLQSLY